MSVKRILLPLFTAFIVSCLTIVQAQNTKTFPVLKRDANPKRPTAIFCANDEMAMGCLHAVKTAGLKVPVDISVVGFDDNRYAQIMDPPLTTIRQPARKIGERVMQRLLAEIENGRSHDAKPEIVPHELVIRASAAPPRT